MITVTTSRRANPLVRRIGRDFAFASGGKYITRGKGGLTRPPFSEGVLLVLSRNGRGIRVQVHEGSEEIACLHFFSIAEEAREGPRRPGLFSGDEDLCACLSPGLPVHREEGLGGTLVFDGIQGRRISLGVGAGP